MEEIGLREMRQNASELVRRAQAGEHLMITVSGRPAATLGPAAGSTWQTWDNIADIFTLPTDDERARDRDLVDDSLRDPWESA